MYKYFIFILYYLTNVESFFLFNFKNRFSIKKKILKLTSGRLYDYDFINPILNYQNQNNILKLNNYEKVKSIMNSDDTYAIDVVCNTNAIKKVPSEKQTVFIEYIVRSVRSQDGFDLSSSYTIPKIVNDYKLWDYVIFQLLFIYVIYFLY